MKRTKLYGADPESGLVSSRTELVIDGFQGSANSFAESIFTRSQTRPVNVVHHTHAPVTIIRAAELGIPVLLTVREPESTVISLTSRWPYISIAQALESYIGFYTKLKPYAPHYVVSNFKLTTQHLDRVVQAVNAKFQRNFDLPDMDKAHRNRPDSNPEREALKQEKRNELNLNKNTQLLARANSLYQTFEDLSQSMVQF
jgi:hypothetical protein